MEAIDIELECARGLACVWFNVTADQLVFELSRRDGGGWIVSARRSFDPWRTAIEAYGQESAADALERFIANIAEDIRVNNELEATGLVKDIWRRCRDS